MFYALTGDTAQPVSYFLLIHFSLFLSFSMMSIQTFGFPITEISDLDATRQQLSQQQLTWAEQGEILRKEIQALSTIIQVRPFLLSIIFSHQSFILSIIHSSLSSPLSVSLSRALSRPLLLPISRMNILLPLMIIG